MSGSTPPDGHDEGIPQFTFVEEPLGLPASAGFGYFQGGPGLALGPDERYNLRAKLGYGTASSVWLAHDNGTDTAVAIKILSGYATQMNKERKLRELEILQILSSKTQGNGPRHYARLLSHFTHPGIDEDDREHLCLVLDPLWSTVQDVRNTLPSDINIPVPTVKRILRHVLEGMADLHACGIAHTDIKPDNTMIDMGSQWTPKAVESWLEANPPKTHPSERSLKGMVNVFISQPFPSPSVDQLVSCNFKLADYSNSQMVSDQTTDDITPLGLRPPEVVLEGEWSEAVDIWTYGCMVFTLLTNRGLFYPVEVKHLNYSEEDVLLYQMILFSGESFQEDFLRRCSRTSEFFSPDCKLLKFSTYVLKPFEKCISDTGCVLSSDDMAGAVDLMTKCLHIDPKNRATAQELRAHPWLKL